MKNQTESQGGKNRRRHGPVPMPATKKRSHRITVFCREDELAQLTEKAGSAAEIPGFLRAAGLGRRGLSPRRLVVPELNQEAYAKLARAASNLNQIAHALNIGEADTRPGIEEIQNELANFRRRLLGQDLLSPEQLEEPEEEEKTDESQNQ